MLTRSSLLRKPQIGAAINFGHPLAKGLVGCWLMNEVAGARAFDISGNNNHMTLGDATHWTTIGPFSNVGLKSNNDLQCSCQALTGIPSPALNDITMSAWAVMTTNSGKNEVMVLSNTGDGAANTLAISNEMGTWSIGGYGNIVTPALASGVTPVLNKLTFLVYVRSGSTNYIYVDGVNCANNSNTPQSGSYVKLCLFSFALTYDFFYGYIPLAYIHNRALSGQEILQLYDSPFSFLKQPKRAWSFVKAPATGIVFDAASNSGYQAANSTYSWNHTCTGANGFLGVDVELMSIPGTTVTSITYNGVNLSFIGATSSGGGTLRNESWGLINPTLGTNTISVTLSASISSTGTASSYTGVHQTSPTESYNGATATNGVGAADATVNITPVADNCYIYGVCNSNDTTITANQTSRNNVSGATGSGANEDTGPISPAVSTAISYTGVGGTQTWVMSGYAIRPITASSLSIARSLFRLANLALGAGGSFFGSPFKKEEITIEKDIIPSTTRKKKRRRKYENL